MEHMVYLESSVGFHDQTMTKVPVGTDEEILRVMMKWDMTEGYGGYAITLIELLHIFGQDEREKRLR